MAKLQKREKSDRPKLGELIKGLPELKTPIQEVVRPVTKNATEELEKINGFWVYKGLAKRLKQHGLDQDMTQREILIAALEAYLPK